MFQYHLFLFISTIFHSSIATCLLFGERLFLLLPGLPMAVHGLGSSGSPIVISDEEDAAYVEQELSADRWNSLPRRLDLVDQDPNYSTQFTAPSDAAPTNGAGTSRKRKWNQLLVSEQVPSSHTSPSDAQENTHDPQPEGKRARKKRLKRERAMAEAEIREYSPSSLPQLPPSPQHAIFRPPLESSQTSYPLLSLPPASPMWPTPFSLTNSFQRDSAAVEPGGPSYSLPSFQPLSAYSIHRTGEASQSSVPLLSLPLPTPRRATVASSSALSTSRVYHSLASSSAPRRLPLAAPPSQRPYTALASSNVPSAVSLPVPQPLPSVASSTSFLTHPLPLPRSYAAAPSSLPSSVPPMSSSLPLPRKPLTNVTRQAQGLRPWSLAQPMSMTSQMSVPAIPHQPIDSTTVSSSVLPPNPTPGPALPPVPSAHQAPTKIIGMPVDLNNRRGFYPDIDAPIPVLDHTLVMELLPKKFRNVTFLTNWAYGYGDAVRVEMDVKVGKGFVEFASAAQADAAYNSPRLPGGEGREHIRVWWFRRDNVGSAKEMEEGELEEGELPETEPPVGTKLWWKKQKAQKTHRRKKGLELADRLSGASAPVHMREERRPPNETWPAYSRVEAQNFSHGVMDAPRPPLLSRFSLPEHGWSYNESDERISEDLFSTALPDSPPLMEDLLVGAGDEEAMELESDDGRDMAFVGLLESPNWIDDEQSIASSRPGSPVAQPTAIDTEQASLPATSVVEVAAVAHSLAVDLEHEPVAPTKATPVEEPSSASVTSSSGATSSFCFTSSFGVAPSCGATEATPEALLTCDSSRSPSPPLLPCFPPDSPSATGMPPYYSPSSPFYTRSPSCEPSTNNREAILARRQLLARRKALEDAIAKTKLQLANKLRNTSESSSSSEPTTPPSDAIGSGLVTGAGKNADRSVFEDSLRRAVLESRPKVSSPSRPFSVTTPSSMDDMDIDMTAPASPRRVAGSTTIIRTSNNLEELAVSFITETIRTVKPPPAKPAQTEKMRLLAKQKRLEQHIAESKMLMAKLTAARTKEEKGAILGVLRERRRVMDEEAKAEAVAHEISPPAYSVQTVAQKFRTRWPETQPEATIIIISDDEDDD